MQSDAQNRYPAPGTRVIGSVNWLGLWTLYLRETRRFMKVWAQTLASPAVTTILFMIIFSLALGGQGRQIAGYTYGTFLAPGLIVMTMLQNAFANTSSSLIIAKVQGNIVDTLMPPLSATELTAGFVLGGISRGLLVGASVAFAFLLMPGVDMGITHLWATIYFAFMGSAMLSLIGVLTGVWAEKFDHTAAITNFVVAPLSLLSGTFYTIDRLAPAWQAFSRANPFFYLIDGFRYGFIGHADSDITTGALYVLVINIVLTVWAYQVFKRGYRLKA